LGARSVTLFVGRIIGAIPVLRSVTTRAYSTTRVPCVRDAFNAALAWISRVGDTIACPTKSVGGVVRKILDFLLNIVLCVWGILASVGCLYGAFIDPSVLTLGEGFVSRASAALIGIGAGTYWLIRTSHFLEKEKIDGDETAPRS
jgi:hypothetical protein